MDKEITTVKKDIYDLTYSQIKSLLHDEKDLIACLGNVCAVLKENFNFWWVGFYIVRGNELVLGPFQGPVACTRISLGKGVCGTSWQNKKTIVVPNVHEFPGHIACSALSNSEIVIPVIKNNEVLMVLDIDSEFYNTFDSDDQYYLEKIVDLIVEIC